MFCPHSDNEPRIRPNYAKSIKVNSDVTVFLCDGCWAFVKTAVFHEFCKSIASQGSFGKEIFITLVPTHQGLVSCDHINASGNNINSIRLSYSADFPTIRLCNSCSGEILQDSITTFTKPLIFPPINNYNYTGRAGP